MAGRSQSSWTLFFHFPRCISRASDWTGTLRIWVTHMGCLHCRLQLAHCTAVVHRQETKTHRAEWCFSHGNERHSYPKNYFLSSSWLPRTLSLMLNLKMDLLQFLNGKWGDRNLPSMVAPSDCQMATKDPGTHLGLPDGWQGSKHVSHHMPLSPVHQHETGTEVEPLRLKLVFWHGMPHYKPNRNTIPVMRFTEFK